MDNSKVMLEMDIKAYEAYIREILKNPEHSLDELRRAKARKADLIIELSKIEC